MSVLETIIFIFGFRIAREYERGVVFRLGRYHGTRGPGLFWIIPLIDAMQKIDLRTITVEIESQEAITRDSVAVKVNAVLYYRIVKPSDAVIEVEDYIKAIYQACLTTIRNIIGQHNLDELLKERDAINAALHRIIGGISESWGIEVQIVEIKTVEIPERMQRAMAREAEAVREKRARIIKAEAEEEASEKLVSASRKIETSPASLELRRMQMIAEVGAEQHTSMLVLMPSEFVYAAREAGEFLSELAEKKDRAPSGEQEPSPRRGRGRRNVPPA